MSVSVDSLNTAMGQQIAVRPYDQIILIGDSIFAGTVTISDPTLRLAGLLRTAIPTANVIDHSLAGQFLSTYVEQGSLYQVGNNLDAERDPGRRRDILLNEGIVNIIRSAGAVNTAGSLDRLANWCAARIASRSTDNPFEMFLFDCLPATTGDVHEDTRLEVNFAFRNGDLHDMISDRLGYESPVRLALWSDIPELGPELEKADDTDWYADGIHLNAAGTALVRDFIIASVLPLASPNHMLIEA